MGSIKINEDEKMKKFFVILVCKLLHFIGKIIGKGSSLPGKVALKLDRNILKKIKMPQYIIAVTGSNGKTSTVEMIAHILRSSGKTVAYNKEGSNQIEGVTTFILCGSTMGGKVKSDILLIESDERFAQYTFDYFTPTHYVITNLYRDQLTRNGHPEWVFDCIKNSIHDGTQLILNADDPLVSCFGYNRENVVYFGADEISVSHKENNSRYNDGIYCPNCKQKLSYEFYHYNHIGKYLCPNCGLKRNETTYTVTSADLEKGEITINSKYSITLALKSLYNVYNILAAFAVCSIVGVDEEAIAQSINNYVLQNGRVIQFSLGERHGTLLTSKHENSVSYDQSIAIAANDKDGCDVVIIVDAVSRKYFTSDVSWLWDIDFENLASENVNQIILSGTYVNDLVTRFAYSGIDEGKIKAIADIGQMAEYLKSGGDKKVYVITCFSDKGKFLELVKEEQP